MVQWVKPTAPKPDDLSSIPDPTWWKERTKFQLAGTLIDYSTF